MSHPLPFGPAARMQPVLFLSWDKQSGNAELQQCSVGCGGELRGTSGPRGWAMMKCRFHLRLFCFLLLHQCSQHPGCTFGLASHSVCVKEVLVRKEGHWESLERMPGPTKWSGEHPGGCRQPGCVGTLVLSVHFPLQSCRAV